MKIYTSPEIMEELEEMMKEEIRKEFFEKIDKIVRDCSFEGWDSYSAPPINKETGELAKQIAEFFLEGDWFVCPSLDGEIAFYNINETMRVSVWKEGGENAVKENNKRKDERL